MIAAALFLGYFFYCFNLNKCFNSSGINIVSTESIIDDINNSSSKEYLKIDGVFAVSAMILTNDNKIILSKRKGENKWIQPGTYIRTNTIYKGYKGENVPPFLTPQKQLLEKIYQDTGINASNLEYVDIFMSDINTDVNTLSRATDPEARYSDLKDNFLSPSPFLIQLEHSSQLKSSKTHNHADMFYIYKLKRDVRFDTLKIQIMQEANNNSEVCFQDIDAFDLDEIKELVTHHRDNIYVDMAIISDITMGYYRRYKHFKNSTIRHCTFNTDNHVLWIRTSNYCNARCKFCLMSDRRKSGSSSNINNTDSLLSVLQNNSYIYKHQDLKMIISGGEPFLIPNLINSLVFKVLKLPEYRDVISKVSICTNGTLCASDYVESDIIKLNDYCKQKDISFKIVLDIPGFDAGSYASLTRMTGKEWNKLMRFAKFLNSNNIEFCVNVIMSTIFENKFKKYLELWKKNNFNMIQLSYVIRNAKNDNSLFLNRDKCLKLFNIILSGKYRTEFIDKIDLIIPECNDKYCQSSNIYSIFYNHNSNEYMLSSECLDKQA